METVRNDYAEKGVEFVYIYKALAHPEWNGYVTAVNLDERLAHVKEFKRTTGSKFTWLVDSMNNAMKYAMGRAPNSEWVIDPEGIIVRRRDWSNADDLRADLEELIGPVDHVTTIAELDMPSQPFPEAAAQGVVKRIEREGRMRALKVKHAKSSGDNPFYAKLRVESGRELLETGEGQIYLRFMMDPIYGVHWNNEVDPIKVKIVAPNHVTITPDELVGPTVTAAKGDIDPREFLVDVSGIKKGDTITLKARYFACTDSWCMPMEQEYVVTFEMDRDGGSVINPAFRKRMMEMMNQKDDKDQAAARGGHPASSGS